MNIKEGFELRKICGENIIISHGKENINFTKVISLNESAALIWENISGKDFTIEDMVAVLTDNYEVEADVALADCKSLVAEWGEAGLI
jgi:hypothetical protein